MFYNLSIALMNVAIKAASAFNPKARKLADGQCGLIEKIEEIFRNAPLAQGPTYWIHCASLGEFEQGRPIIEQLRIEQPNCRIVLTFFSPSGYEVRKDYPLADYVFYLPSDTKSNASRFVAAVKPDKAIFVKYEYWYNYLSSLRASGIDSYVVSAIFRPSMTFFKPWGGLFREMLGMLKHLFVQDQASADLLASIGVVDRVTICGDTRFDRVAAITSTAPGLPLVEHFAASSKVLVCGSTWQPDTDLLIELMHDFPQWKFIIAPHEIDSVSIDRLIEKSDRKAVRYTQAVTTDNLDSSATLLVIDCIGILSGVYQYGTAAYIGGGFGVGIHNILEAATWNIPVLFGPKYSKFREAVEMIECGGAFSVSDYQALRSLFSKFSECGQYLKDSSSAAGTYVARNTGATKVIVDYLLSR